MIDNTKRESHSPAPWKASKGAEGEPERWLVVADGEKEFHLATIENGQPGDCLETERMTALLIAAAPDLLEALQAVVQIADRDTNPFFRAKAAIAKALGESL